jgi:hypothetical protein
VQGGGISADAVSFEFKNQESRKDGGASPMLENGKVTEPGQGVKSWHFPLGR